MIKPLSGIDWGKLTVNTLSGFFATLSLIFAIDAFVPTHIAENIIVDTSAGNMILIGMAVIVGSSILGLMIDSIFQIFGHLNIPAENRHPHRMGPTPPYNVFSAVRCE